MNNSRLIYFFVLLSILGAGNCRNKVLAEYEGGNIKQKEIDELADLYNVKNRLDNPDFLKRILKDYAVIKILSERSQAQELDKSREAVYINKLFKGNVIRNVLYQKKQEDSNSEKEPVYHARHILIKVAQAPAGKTEKDKKIKTSDGKKEYDTIMEIRADILNKKIKFEEAAKKYSEDESTKSNEGDLGHFTSGIMVEEFENALERMSGNTKGTPMRIVANKVKFLSNPEGSEAPAPEKDSIVTVLENNIPPGWSKIATKNYTVYIPSNQLANIENEEKISAPVRTMYGWHIIELLEKKDVDLKGYTKLIKKDELKKNRNNNNAESIAASRAKMFWSRLKSSQLSGWQRQLYTDYGLEYASFPTLSNDWQKSENLLKDSKIKVSGADLKDFINWIALDQGVTIDSILNNKEALQRYFKIYAELEMYTLEGEKQKITESKMYKKRGNFERQQFLSELYKKKMWYPQVTYTDKELKEQYDKMVKTAPPHMKKIQPFNQMKSELIQQIRGQRINMMSQQKTQELLDSVKFRFVEKSLLIK